MTTYSKDPKIDRKSLKNPDFFVQRGQKVVGALFDQRTPLITVAVIGLAIILGFYAFQRYSAHKADKSWEQLAEISKAPEAERWGKYEKLYQDNSWSRPRYFAALAVADHYFDETKKELAKTGGDVAKPSASALDWYNKSLDYKDLMTKERQLVLTNRGMIFEMQKKYDEAIADYQKASELSPDGKAFALLNLARGFELKGDVAKATQAYDKIVLEFKDSEYAKLAKNYLRRLKSPLFKAEAKKG